MSVRSKKGKSNSIDVAIGGCLRQKRLERNISQQELGCAIGVTFQQVQKYENGHNRLSASRLYMAAHALNIDIKDFFPEEAQERVVDSVPSIGSYKTLKEAIAAFEKIKDPDIRKKIEELCGISE